MIGGIGVEKLVLDTFANRALSGNLLPLNNNACFAELSGVSTVAVVEDDAKYGSVPVAFGLMNRCSQNQLYCSFVVTSPKYDAVYVNVETVSSKKGESKNDETEENKPQHVVLRITETMKTLPNLAGLPQYYSAFCEPAARPLLQCVVDQLIEQSVGHLDVEMRRNLTVDICDNTYGQVDKLWRDFSGFVVTDRFRYLEIDIERQNFLNILNGGQKEELPSNFRIEKLTESNFDLILDYDQSVAVMNRSDFLEYLFGLYGTAGTVVLDEQYQPVGYVLSLNENLLQCYAEDEDIANALLIHHVQNNMTSKQINMFVRNNEEWISEKLAEKAIKVSRVRRLHSRIMPNSVKWTKVYAYNMGLHLF